MSRPARAMECSYLVHVFLVSCAVFLSVARAQLFVDYYSKTCPDFLNVVQQIAVEKQLSNPTTAAGTLRVFFHDCMVEGCDGSILLASNSFGKSERDADINLSLPGDAFEVIIRIKTALELKCPGVVSCSDLLAVVTRDLITMVGGPFYKLRFGRKDSLASHESEVEGHIARANMTITEIIKRFADQGFSVKEMVTLSGAHTIGFSHCEEFADRIFNFSKASPIDPTMNPKYAKGLQGLCADVKKRSLMAAFNDAVTPGKFDNVYYVNLQRGLGLLASDQALASDPRTKPFVDLYAGNQKVFFDDFAAAIQKVSEINVLTGKKGEVRRRCDVPNSAPGS